MKQILYDDENNEVGFIDGNYLHISIPEKTIMQKVEMQLDYEPVSGAFHGTIGDLRVHTSEGDR